MPDPRLPEIRLPRPPTGPPIVLFEEPLSSDTPSRLGTAAVPAASVPISLLATRTLAVPTPTPFSEMPEKVLPEITLRLAAPAPPMVALVTPRNDTPTPLARPVVPEASMPRKFPSIASPVRPSAAIALFENWTIARPRIVTSDAAITIPSVVPASWPSIATRITASSPTASELTLAPGWV